MNSKISPAAEAPEDIPACAIHAGDEILFGEGLPEAIAVTVRIITKGTLATSAEAMLPDAPSRNISIIEWDSVACRDGIPCEHGTACYRSGEMVTRLHACAMAGAA